MNGPSIRVLVIDNSVMVRKLLTTIIDADPELEVVGVAADGRVGRQRIAQLQPDVVTLDIDMPGPDGLDTLRAVRVEHPRLPVVLFSTPTEQGAAVTVDALIAGASDYVVKPANVGSVGAAMERVSSDLIPRIKALCGRSAAPRPLPARPAPRSARRADPPGHVELVVIGSSTGGPTALATVVAGLPGDLPVPVLVVQHMPPMFTRFLARSLDVRSELTVQEGSPGVALEPGHAWIAPGDVHMTVARRSGAAVLTTNTDAHEHRCRPAVDVLFRSAAQAHRGNVLAVVLSGMGTDGRDGCAEINHAGGRVIVQDQASSVVWEMPGAIVAAGLADEVLPLSRIAAAIIDRVESSPVARLAARTQELTGASS